jgi:AcrR family transcriptional regulator
MARSSEHGASTTPDPTRARLLNAAGEEFAEKGFEAARVRAICQRAGANVAAVNYYFGDKEQLYVQAVLEAHRCEMPAPAEPGAADEPPASQLRRFIRGFLTNVLAMNRDPSWHNALLMREMLRPTGAAEVLVRDSIRPRFERLRAIIQRICPEAQSRRLDALTFSVIGQCLHYKMARAVSERLIGLAAFESLDVDFLTDHITTFCLAALGQGPVLGRDGEPSGGVPDAAGTLQPARGRACPGSL